MYDNYTYQYLRDYIKPLLDNMYSSLQEVLTSLTSDESAINKSLTALIDKANSILTNIRYIFWLLCILLFVIYTFKFLQARWFTVK